MQIEALRLEQEQWNKSFASRQAAAETLVKRELRHAKMNPVQPDASQKSPSEAGGQASAALLPSSP